MHVCHVCVCVCVCVVCVCRVCVAHLALVGFLHRLEKESDGDLYRNDRTPLDVV